MRVQRLLIGLILSSTALSASAFERPFPDIAKRGTMSPGEHPAIIIDGKVRHLSAGGRIWNTDNLIQMPSSFPKGSYVVNYTESFQGDIDRIWILSREEAKKPAPGKK